MSRAWDDERLAEAFRSLADAPQTQAQEENVDSMRVWKAVSGELPADERRQLIEELADNPALAEAWRLANELQRSSRFQADVVSETPRPARSFLKSPAVLAAAAAVLLAIGAGLVLRLDSPNPTFRGSSVSSLVAEGASLPREDFVLRWSELAEGTRYDLRVTTEDLTVLVNVESLSESQYRVSETSLSELTTGARVLWQVDARLVNGDVIASETFVTRLE